MMKKCDDNDPQNERLQDVRLFLAEQYNRSMIRFVQDRYRKLRNQSKNTVNRLFVHVKSVGKGHKSE